MSVLAREGAPGHARVRALGRAVFVVAYLASTAPGCFLLLPLFGIRGRARPAASRVVAIPSSVPYGSLALTGEARGLERVEGASPRAACDRARASAADGTVRLVTSAGGTGVDAVASDGRTESLLAPGFARIDAVAESPDRGRLALGLADGRTVGLYDRAARTLRYLTGGRTPSWSADGAALLVSVTAGARCEVRRVNAETGETRALISVEGSCEGPSEAPDRARFVFASQPSPSQPWTLYSALADGSGLRALTGGSVDVRSAHWCGDGRVYFRTGEELVWRLDPTAAPAAPESTEPSPVPSSPPAPEPHEGRAHGRRRGGGHESHAPPAPARAPEGAPAVQPAPAPMPSVQPAPAPSAQVVPAPAPSAQLVPAPAAPLSPTPLRAPVAAPSAPSAQPAPRPSAYTPPPSYQGPDGT